ncbi:hypothetical protein [Helicobacter sp. MIT 11-5569]|uniref:hypothetical protein n=1 Tax=Helicobacter sp. MIT 11-5569 TaxID=1548151 RepID=UPI000B1C7970|nr:hypothetical protein [Helicobacter sp. MIT 11-5569]
MRYLSAILILAFFGCSNTWSGVKEDSKEVYDWSKKKVNQGASWVEEKTAE